MSFGGGHHFRGGNDFSSSLQAVDFGAVEVVQSEWNFYRPAPPRSEAEVSEWLQRHSVTVYGDRVPQPMFQFSDLVAPDVIHQAFADRGYTEPTPIQSVAWPILLNSRDLVGVAKTGSGKTMAFMVPAALHIMAQAPLRLGDGPIALVLAPTRELAVQIEEETRKVLRRVPQLSCTCLYGGAPKQPQYRALRAGVHVVIATPGRLIDMLESKATNLLRVTYLVLDEADRMLDMGFEPQVRTICSQIRPDRQTLMFSATWPVEIRKLAMSFQRDFVRVHVGSEDLLANSDVRQHIVVCNEQEKFARLMDTMRVVGAQRVLIFVSRKATADALHNALRAGGRPTYAIHGDKDQATRDFAIDSFRRDPHATLVATDVAARGLDIRDLDVVVNFDFPSNIEDYVHRIGRTGRAGKTGDSYTFVTPNDPGKTVRDLVDLLQRGNAVVPPELLPLAGGSASFYRRPAISSFSAQARAYGHGAPAPAGHAPPHHHHHHHHHAPAPPLLQRPAGVLPPPPPRARHESFATYDDRRRDDSRGRRRDDSHDRRRRDDSHDRRRRDDSRERRHRDGSRERRRRDDSREAKSRRVDQHSERRD